jgi:predicted RNA polymerase sigma factor
MGLALLDANDVVDTSNYPYVHLVRGALLGELGRIEEARTSLALAEEHARNAPERTQIRARMSELEAAAELASRGVK